ncbi:zinc finger protein 665-like [Rhipicephalus sanguineus]|uniref:zinc finger protein 665-like n=1 Tax=Rhipicephalus sanguineus TaxID=34632 RepID=UPI001894A568|nr:zinc finger protein 665-like [Rhipicephalus sanguineus]
MLYIKCGIYLVGKITFLDCVGHHDYHRPIESSTSAARAPSGPNLQGGDPSGQTMMIVKQEPPSTDSSQDSTSMETLHSGQPNATTGQSSQIPMVVLVAPSRVETVRVPSPHSHSCHLCPETFASKELLDVHLNTHPSYCPHKCDRCSEVFTNVRLLELHMRFHHKCECLFRCSICLLSFATKRALTTHLTKHDHGRVQCKICSEWFDSCRALLDHRTKHFAL